MAGENDEQPRLLAHAPVDGQIKRWKPLSAAVIGALADEGRLGRSAPVLLFEARDALVDFAEERLVARRPLLP